jgi:hypothetical protein
MGLEQVYHATIFWPLRRCQMILEPETNICLCLFTNLSIGEHFKLLWRATGGLSMELVISAHQHDSKAALYFPWDFL